MLVRDGKRRGERRVSRRRQAEEGEQVDEETEFEPVRSKLRGMGRAKTGSKAPPHCFELT